MFKVISLQQAHRLIKKHWNYAKTEVLTIEKALGRTLAQDVVALTDFPPFTRGTVDGFAVRSQDVHRADEENPVHLKLIGEVRVGRIPTLMLSPKSCAKIETGAPIPKGADAVVPWEFTDQKGDLVEVYRPVAPGENIVKKGSRAKKGEILFKTGDEITPEKIGVLAACGIDKVKVFRPPSVGILSTGDELQSLGEPLQGAKIFDVNGPMLASLVREAGCQVVPLGISRDREHLLRRKILEGLKRCDVLIVSGGTSAGERDMLPSLLEPLFHGLAVKPGKPTMFSMINGKPVFCLPGNPLSTYVMFRELVLPHLLRASGRKIAERKIRGRLLVDLRSEAGKDEFVFAKLIDGKVQPLREGSDAITILRLADGYFRVPRNVEWLRAGEEVVVKLVR